MVLFAPLVILQISVSSQTLKLDPFNLKRLKASSATKFGGGGGVPRIYYLLFSWSCLIFKDFYIREEK